MKTSSKSGDAFAVVAHTTLASCGGGENSGVSMLTLALLAVGENRTALVHG
jgi:hypothetical protein